jgi:hypothetical protein
MSAIVLGQQQQRHDAAVPGLWPTTARVRRRRPDDREGSALLFRGPANDSRGSALRFGSAVAGEAGTGPVNHPVFVKDSLEEYGASWAFGVAGQLAFSADWRDTAVPAVFP